MALVIAAFIGGLSLSTNATAATIQPQVKTPPKLPCSGCGGGAPYPIRSTEDNATATGTAVPSNQTITPTVTFQNGSGDSITGFINAETDTVEVSLPHTYEKLHEYHQDGEAYLQLYLSTQSEYAPNGDSGTFTFNSAGDLVSGSAAALIRIENEADEADPLITTQANGLFGWFKSNWHRIASCGEFALGVAGLVSGVGDIPDAATLGAALWGGIEGLGGDVGLAAAANCF